MYETYFLSQVSCLSCRYFRHHYVKEGEEFRPLFCGHCGYGEVEEDRDPCRHCRHWAPEEEPTS